MKAHLNCERCVHRKYIYIFISNGILLILFVLLFINPGYLHIFETYLLYKKYLKIVIFKANQSFFFFKQCIQYFYIECLRVYKEKSSIKNVQVLEIKCISSITLNVK